jgi:arginine transport system substrate-binding protein
MKIYKKIYKNIIKNILAPQIITSVLNLGILIILFLLTACNNTQKINSQQESSDTLIVGTNSGFPPYEATNDKGEIIGFDIDVAQALAQKLGKKLVVKDLSFDALILALKQGKVDIILAGISITQARQQEIALVHYHGDLLTHLPLLFWKNIPPEIKTLEDFKKYHNKTICAQAGTIQDEIISKQTFLDIKHLENIHDLILDIKCGGSIAALLEPAVATHLQQQCPEIKILSIPLTPQEQTFGNGIGIKKENILLVKKISQAIEALKQTGVIKKLEKFWFKNQGASS